MSELLRTNPIVLLPRSAWIEKCDDRALRVIRAQ